MDTAARFDGSSVRPDASARPRTDSTVLLAGGFAIVPTVVSALGMFGVFRAMGMNLVISAGTSFFLEGLLVTLALLARRAIQNFRSARSEMTWTWIVSFVSGTLSAAHEFVLPDGTTAEPTLMRMIAAAVRIAAPLAAALLWHRVLVADELDATPLPPRAERRSRRLVFDAACAAQRVAAAPPGRRTREAARFRTSWQRAVRASMLHWSPEQLGQEGKAWTKALSSGDELVQEYLRSTDQEATEPAAAPDEAPAAARTSDVATAPQPADSKRDAVPAPVLDMESTPELEPTPAVVMESAPELEPRPAVVMESTPELEPRPVVASTPTPAPLTEPTPAEAPLGTLDPLPAPAPEPIQEELFLVGPYTYAPRTVAAHRASPTVHGQSAPATPVPPVASPRQDGNRPRRTPAIHPAARSRRAADAVVEPEPEPAPGAFENIAVDLPLDGAPAVTPEPARVSVAAATAYAAALLATDDSPTPESPAVQEPAPDTDSDADGPSTATKLEDGDDVDNVDILMERVTAVVAQRGGGPLDLASALAAHGLEVPSEESCLELLGAARRRGRRAIA